MSSIEIQIVRRVLIAAISMVIGASDGSANVDCLVCHGDMLEDAARHFIECNDDCQVCHVVVGEGTTHPQLAAIDTNRCRGCHRRAALSVGNTRHELLACTSCHDPHGSKQDHNHLAEHNALCLSSCHTLQELGQSHPRGNDARDVVTGQELTCVLACHSNHSFRHPKFLQEDRKILCARCHADKY